jgi:hypothetical protein
MYTVGLFNGTVLTAEVAQHHLRREGGDVEVSVNLKSHILRYSRDINLKEGTLRILSTCWIPVSTV